LSETLLLPNELALAAMLLSYIREKSDYPDWYFSWSQTLHV